MCAEGLNELVGKEVDRLIGKVIEVSVSIISPDPENLREVFDTEDIKDLGINMLSVGQLDEITLFPKQDDSGLWTGEFDLHDGERRWRAAQMVGIDTLRAKVIERPTDQELLFKKTSRALQTRMLDPEKKMEAVKNSFMKLGVWNKPELWENYRKQLGGGAEWPQIVRILKAEPIVKEMLDEGEVNFTLAQSISRLPQERQEEAAKYVVVNKISGRFFSAEMIPYLMEKPDASMSQAFEHARVGNWRKFMKSPFKRGEEPPTEQRIEDFLDSCVNWEHAWEVLVHEGLVFHIIESNNYKNRVLEALQRLDERIRATINRIENENKEISTELEVKSPPKLIE